MPRCALYARTSADKGQTPQNQLRQLRAFARSQGWQLVAEFVDAASGARAERPQFQAMLESASRREFDLLLFWSLDRFSREGILETLISLKRLSDYGVKYRSLQESYIDTTHPFGDLLAAFLWPRSPPSSRSGSGSGSWRVWSGRGRRGPIWGGRGRRSGKGGWRG